ncbi:MAG TPA: NAD(P)-binding domain-containing protein, partial [Candidatus Acidoferrales bacterium]|nr:NAD(P)-binding domain-containing protein [Candidatus Acidoferrales bacterium]
MAFHKIGILSIGEMGYHWAKILTARGVEVMTFAGDRSETTRQRAENVGVKCLPSMNQLVQEADLIVSIVVPSAAKKVAAKTSKAAIKTGRKDLLYLDANAISPMTAEEIGKTLAGGDVEFVDGCIIGSAAKMDKGAVIYVSGARATEVLDLNSYGFSVKVLGPAVAQASAFKVVYAGLTKGLQGLFVELLMGARSFGLLDEILQRYEESFPGLLDKVNASIVALRIHAGRRAEEMDELRRTFNHHGMNSFMAPAV